MGDVGLRVGIGVNILVVGGKVALAGFPAGVLDVGCAVVGWLGTGMAVGTGVGRACFVGRPVGAPVTTGLNRVGTIVCVGKGTGETGTGAIGAAADGC